MKKRTSTLMLNWLLIAGLPVLVLAQNAVKEALSADSLLHLVNAAVAKKDFEQANDFLNRASAQAKGDSMRAEIDFGRGKLLVAEGKLPEAAAEFEKTVNVGKSLANRGLQVKGYMNWLSALVNSRQLEKAEAVLAEAKATARQAQDPKEMASEMANLENFAAIIFYHRKDIPSAIASYQSGVAVARQYGINDKLPKLYDNIALAYFRSGMPDSAKVYLDLAGAVAMAEKDTLILSNVSINLGNYFWQKGQLDSATHYFERCQYWSGLMKSERRVAISAVSKAAVLGEMGQPEKALSAYFEALPCWKNRTHGSSPEAMGR